MPSNTFRRQRAVVAAELRPSANILWVAVRWRYQSHVNLEIAYDNLEFQVVVAQISRLGRSQDVVQHMFSLYCLGGGTGLWVSVPCSSYWPAHRAGLLWLNFFGQPGSVSKFPPFVWVKLWVGWVGRGYTEISRYFPASWINWVTLVTKIKLLYSLRF